MSTMAPTTAVHADLTECEHPERCAEENHFYPGGLPSGAWGDDES